MEFEVIVVDDCSRDATVASLNNVAVPYQLTVIAQDSQQRSAARARNVGAEHASGEIIVFLDSDMLAHPALLSKHREYHEKAQRVVLGYRFLGKQLDCYPNFDSFTDASLLRWLDRQGWGADERDSFIKATAEERCPDWGCLYSHNFSILRTNFLHCGGFDEGFHGCGVEDVELGYRLYRLGIEFMYAIDAIAYHQFHPRSETRWRDNLFNIRYLQRLHPELLGFCDKVVEEWRRSLPANIGCDVLSDD